MDEHKHKTEDSDANSDVNKEWEELEQMLATLVKEQKPARLRQLNEIFKAAIKLARETPGTLNLKITASVLRELRFSFKMFSHHRHAKKITIFGSARTLPETPLYEFAKKFAELAVKKKYMVITGGGPGIMAAGNEGAEKESFGLNIRLPFEQSANPFIDPKSMLVHYKYFFTRKLFLVKEAAAFAFFPGGFGTFDESFEVLTLLQTGKTNLIPVVFLEPEGFGFWEAFTNFIQSEVLPRGFISPSDHVLYRIFHSPQEALGHIEHFYKNYHSMRFVKEKISIRLKTPLSKATLKEIKEKFKSLSTDGTFELGAPLQEELNEPELQKLCRLVFPCDRKDFATLRRLIDFINDHTV